MRRALPTALAVAGAVGLVAGVLGWVLALVLPDHGPGPRVGPLSAGGWPVLDTGLRLAAACVAVAGAAALTGVACALLAGRRGSRRLTGTTRWVAAGGGAAVVVGAVAVALAPPAEGGLLYLSPEQYSTLVDALRVQRAGEVVAAAGLIVLAGALGRLGRDRSR